MTGKRQYHLEDGRVLDDITGKVISNSNMSSFYFEKIILHRIDGPAVTYPSGYKAYWIHGSRHNIYGPAIQYSDGRKLYYLFGIRYSKREYTKIIKKLNKTYLAVYLLDPQEHIRKIAQVTYRMLEEHGT